MKPLKFFILLLFGFTVAGLQAQTAECSGTSTNAAEGSFDLGFNYLITTNGDEVNVEFELLDPQDGLIAFAQTYNPDFVETPLNDIGDQTFTGTFAEQTAGEPFNIAVKFAFAGGLATSTIISYTVGEGCAEPTVGDIALPVTFEDAELDYELQDFGDNSSQIVADPTDGSNTVVETTKSAEAELWAGTTVADVSGFAEPIPFAPGATTMTLRIWSPTVGTPIRLKVEQVGVPTISVETEATTTVAEEWETLTFNFANQAPGTAALNFANTYNKASVFFNFGTSGADAGQAFTFYWDDLAFGGDGGGGGDPIELPVTFEDENLNYELQDFGGNASQIIADPTDGNNTVVETTKPDDAELWAGTTVADVSGFAEPIPFAPGATTMTLRIWSPTVGTPVRLKVEQVGVPTISVETEATTTVAEEWETLTFDFADEAPGTAAINFANTYNKASVFFNYGTSGADAGQAFTFYWDDLAFEGNGGGDPVAECSGTSTDAAEGSFDMGFNYLITTDGDDVNVEFELLDPQDGLVAFAQTYNPDFVETPLNDIGNQTFTGTFAGQTAGEPFNIAVKFAYAGGFATSTIIQYTVGEGCAEPTGGDITLPVTFEDTELNYELQDFGGNVSEIVADPTDGINTVVETTKLETAETFAGTTVADASGFAEPIPFAPGATTMTLRIWSPTVGTPVRLKVEQVGVPTISVETEATTTVAEEWETLTFDFANEAPGTAALNFANTYNKASVFFNFGTSGPDAGQAFTFYWDDLAFGGSDAEASISGSIEFDNLCSERDGTLRFYSPGSDVLVEEIDISVNLDGNFTAESTPIGDFDLYIKVDGYLQKLNANVTLNDGDNAVDFGLMIPGDISGNNQINVTDFSQFSTTYGLSSVDAGFVPFADFNCDDVINVQDFSPFSTSYGLVGDMP